MSVAAKRLPVRNRTEVWRADGGGDGGNDANSLGGGLAVARVVEVARGGFSCVSRRAVAVSVAAARRRRAAEGL